MLDSSPATDPGWFVWTDFDAVLFDLDGVITPTADIHERAWAELFSADYDYTDQDYLDHIDGKPRFDGVRDFLASRSVNLPEGDEDDPVEAQTIGGLGNRKNAIFNRILVEEGITPFKGSLDTLDHLQALDIKFGLVSSSRNARTVLAAAGLKDRFPVVVDGNTTAERGLPGKPAPDGYLLGAKLLGIEPERTVVVEDAVSGVAAGAAGRFGTVIGIDRGAGEVPLLEAGADLVTTDLGHLLPARTAGMERSPVPQGLAPGRFPADPWRLVETIYNPSDLGRTETLFALGNGYLGMRANPEEGRDAHSHGTFLNGFHETWDIKHAEDAFGFARTGQTIVNVPDTKLIKLYVDDEPLLLSSADLESYNRTLDFKDGILTRELVWVTPGGKSVRVRSKRLLSFVHRHLAVMEYEVTVIGDAAPVVISSQTLNRQDGSDEYQVPNAALGEGGDPRKANAFTGRVLQPALQREKDGEITLGYRATKSGMTVACGTRHTVESSTEVKITTEIGADHAETTFSTTAMPGEPIRLTKLVAYHSSTGVPADELADRCARTMDRAEETGIEGIEQQQREFLDRFWDSCDVTTTGGDHHQQAIRWNLYQLVQAAAATNEQSIPAKGVSGGGYDGHYFWDTEAYVVPFLTYTNPVVARKVLRFRYKTLDRARIRAGEMNESGALFAWRTINGDECSAYYAAGTAQYHINAAVAYAISRYVNGTGDLRYLMAEGAEILIETARLWVDLGFYGGDGSFHIHRVTGPDEYTTVVNDNTYTNIMAQFNLRFAAETIRRLRAEFPDRTDELIRRVGLEPGEPAGWMAAADAMFVPFDERLEIHPQDANFLELEPWPWSTTPADRYPLLLNYHPLVIYRHQVLKQADVVLATLMRPEQFTPEQRRRNFDYYDPITTGDSSLSAGVQAATAARVGHTALAWDYFQQALYLDLCDTHSNAADGVHIASSGGVWNAVVAGFLGFSDNGKTITLDPAVPEEMGTVTVRMQVRGQSMLIEAEGERAAITTTGDGDIAVADGSGRTLLVSRGAPATIGPAPTD